jgi:hypothetical protein
MFAEEISLWTNGPVVSVGEYFIWFRYLFCFLVLVWAASAARWPRGPLVLLGAILLAALGWMAFDLPLGRLYGLSEDGRALEELGAPMVAAARRSPAEGAMVGERNPWPFWSFLVALASGFDPDRLLDLYPWLPLLSLVLVALSGYAALGSLGAESDSPRGLAPALGVFFMLFLSAPRLSFLESEGILWTDAFGIRPRLGAAIALTLLSFRSFARAERVGAFVLAGFLLGAAGWVDSRCLLLGAAGVASWALVSWRRGEPQGSAWIGLAVAAGTYLLWPAGASSISPATPIGTWHEAARSLLSVSLDQGAVFYLALYACARFYRERSRPKLLFLCWIVSAYALWTLASVSGAVASVLDRALIKSLLRILLAGAAGVGAHRSLLWIGERFALPNPPAILRGRPTYALGLGALLALSIPWAFPFWWNPVRMDRVWMESFPPLSRQIETLGDWVRRDTDREAVFAAGPGYARWIPALAGRRVLSNDGALRSILASRETDTILEAARRWRVTHVAWGRLDAGAAVSADVSFLQSSPIFSLVHRQRRWVSVFQIRAP